ncbi:hypothetical protein TNCV_4036541 [Trichonephila clavipes]|nr:hypothetical protein TNCV_4036541 [Trichonephila clavipes]
MTASNFDAQFLSRREAPVNSADVKFELKNLILPRATKPNVHSRDLFHAAQSYNMAAVDFLYHEYPLTCAEVEPATLGTEGQRQINHATHAARMKKKIEHAEDQIQSSNNHIKNLSLLTSSKYNELNGKWCEDRTTKIVFNAQPIGTRRKGRPNLRRIDGLKKDLLVLRTRNWRTLAERRLAWKRLLGGGQGPSWAVVLLRKEGRRQSVSRLVRL